MKIARTKAGKGNRRFEFRRYKNLLHRNLVLSARSWVKTEEYWTARWRLLEEIKLAFDEQGLEIPYQHMTVQMKATAEN